MKKDDIVVCIENPVYAHITINKTYKVIDVLETYIAIRDDNNGVNFYSMLLFKPKSKMSYKRVSRRAQ